MTIAVPEQLTASVGLAELSRLEALAGDDRLARLAAWAHDVHQLESLLWANGLGEAPDPTAELAGLGEAVAAAITARAETITEGATSGEVVEAAREALLSTFDESVHALVLDRLLPLAHLDEPDVDPTDLDGLGHLGGLDERDGATGTPEDDTVGSGGPSKDRSALERLEGRAPEQLVGELLATASDCMVVADLMTQEAVTASAVRLARQADAASFEAYLTAAALRAGDDGLGTVDLRWALARALPPVPVPTGTEETRAEATETVVGGAVVEVRDRLLQLVGYAERAALLATFEPLQRR